MKNPCINLATYCHEMLDKTAKKDEKRWEMEADLLLLTVTNQTAIKWQKMLTSVLPGETAPMSHCDLIWHRSIPNAVRKNKKTKPDKKKKKK